MSSPSLPLSLHGRLCGDLYLNLHVFQFTIENCGFILPACSIVASLFYHSLLYLPILTFYFYLMTHTVVKTKEHLWQMNECDYGALVA